MALHEVAFALNFSSPCSRGRKLPCIREVLLRQLLHLLLDFLESSGVNGVGR